MERDWLLEAPAVIYESSIQFFEENFAARYFMHPQTAYIRVMRQ
jgi:hypothetical protein